jgi:6,7-dimethyl-8-ribityllumazine synthase
MLKVASQKTARLKDGRFAIVASTYNRRYVDGMLRAAQAVLTAGGAKVEVHRVPGSFEIPVAAAVLARRPVERPEAILCLGLIWQGATTHAQHIGEAVSDALMQIAVETGVPVIHEVLTVATKEHAEQRCLVPETNRGTEAAQTALAMAALMRRLNRLR